jgi:hypothetical protein
LYRPGAIFGLLILICVLTVTNAYLWTQRESELQQVRILAVRVNAATAYIAAQETAAEVAAKLKIKTDQQQCAARIAGTVKIDALLANVRGTILDLAGVVTNPEAKATLRSRARVFTPYPIPTCDTGANDAGG